jgi:predicted phosphodiesterase
MLPETKPILFTTPDEFDFIEILPVHDMHYGNKNFKMAKWKALKEYILQVPYRYVIWVGDLMENAIPTSKSSMFEQTCTPVEQREFITQQFIDLADRTISVNDGNHEVNRSTKMAGLYPLYDCCCIAGISDRYRSAFSIIDVSVGSHADGHKNNKLHYTIFSTHKAKTLKNFASCDELEGFDIFLCGHDHEPTDRPRAKLIYNQVRHTVSVKNIENINCGSFLDWAGGYASYLGLRPQSDKLYKIVLNGKTDKNISTVGFYL